MYNMNCHGHVSIYHRTEKLNTYTNEMIAFLIGIVGWGGGVQLSPLGTAATNGLLWQPRVIMMMEKSVE
jgi:hypothetical protein